MSQLNLRSGALICIISSLLISGCSSSSLSRANAEVEMDAAVSNQLKQIWAELRGEMGESDHFAKSLVDLRLPARKRKLFVSPETGSRPGDQNSIEKWTDFIYVGNCSEEVPRAALVISPPENHHGEYGFILCVDGEIFKLPAEQVRMSIATPWLLATNTPQGNLDSLKGRITVFVPDRLRSAYPIQ